MAILYGVGNHAMRVLEKHIVPVQDIEVIIDQALSQKESCIEKIPVITWVEFMKNKARYHSKVIVIGARARYEEIEAIITESGLIMEYEVASIDQWAEKYPMRRDNIHDSIEDVKKKEMKSLYKKVGFISRSNLASARILPNRTEGLKMISKGGCIAEVGVAMGEFSRRILDTCKPVKFYAIDIFSDMTRPNWGDENYANDMIADESGNIFGDYTHEEYYRNRFRDEIKKGLVEIRKGLSWECIEALPDDSLDYVYVDAAHDYESVKKDLTALKKKMRRGGIIQFDDYVANVSYGVIPAVNEFIENTSSEVLFYCLSLDSHDNIAIRFDK